MVVGRIAILASEHWYVINHAGSRAAAALVDAPLESEMVPLAPEPPALTVASVIVPLVLSRLYPLRKEMAPPTPSPSVVTPA